MQEEVDAVGVREVEVEEEDGVEVEELAEQEVTVPRYRVKPQA